EAGLQAVHTHQDIGPRCARYRLLEERRGTLPRARLAVGGNRIFEVDDQRIGAAGHCLVEFSRTVGGDEEEGAHQTSIMPSVTISAGPPTLADASAPPRMVRLSSIRLRRPISNPCSIVKRCSPSPSDSDRAQKPANAAAADPVAGSSRTPNFGANMRA